mmetsp:Transcript_21462/g.47225  ORF Transcript_21462/g.47225 Transcript_21462/m.47225 type:complete len:151 (-) Transcript_21462:63-515(-)
MQEEEVVVCQSPIQVEVEAVQQRLFPKKSLSCLINLLLKWENTQGCKRRDSHKGQLRTRWNAMDMIQDHCLARMQITSLRQQRPLASLLRRKKHLLNKHLRKDLVAVVAVAMLLVQSRTDKQGLLGYLEEVVEEQQQNLRAMSQRLKNGQ